MLLLDYIEPSPIKSVSPLTNFKCIQNTNSNQGKERKKVKRGTGIQQIFGTIDLTETSEMQAAVFQKELCTIIEVFDTKAKQGAFSPKTMKV